MKDNNRRSLSSSQTFFMKFLFPALWLCTFGGITTALWVGGFDDAQSPLPPETKWLFLLGLIAGATMIWLLCARNKRVEIDDANLYISNYFREITIPLGQIELVSENRWVSPRQVTVLLRKEIAFGQKIQFMAKTRLFRLWSPHPVVAELREAADLRQNMLSPSLQSGR